ncbi:unnamed protein product [Effrenium voratum]|nr:unnamed protein product [Effrenium voratum]
MGRGAPTFASTVPRTLKDTSLPPIGEADRRPKRHGRYFPAESPRPVAEPMLPVRPLAPKPKLTRPSGAMLDASLKGFCWRVSEEKIQPSAEIADKVYFAPVVPGVLRKRPRRQLQPLAHDVAKELRGKVLGALETALAAEQLPEATKRRVLGSVQRVLDPADRMHSSAQPEPEPQEEKQPEPVSPQVASTRPPSSLAEVDVQAEEAESEAVAQAGAVKESEEQPEASSDEAVQVPPSERADASFAAEAALEEELLEVVDVDNMSDHEFEAFGSVTDDVLSNVFAYIQD